MRYRKLDSDYDMTFGHNLNSFWIDMPEAPAQAVLTRLMMNLGEWFLDRTAGTPWNTKVLGFYTGNTRDPTIYQRINQTQGVKGILQYSSALERDKREFAVTAQIDTIYGESTLLASFGEPI